MQRLLSKYMYIAYNIICIINYRKTKVPICGRHQLYANIALDRNTSGDSLKLHMPGSKGKSQTMREIPHRHSRIDTTVQTRLL